MQYHKLIVILFVASFLITSINYVSAADGDILWGRAFNNGSNDYAHGVAVDSFNSVIVTGQSYNSSTSKYDYCTIKYDSQGNFIWRKSYGTGTTNIGYAVAVDSSNNIIVTGQSNVPSTKPNYCTIKYDSNGNFIWEKRYSIGTTNRAYAVAVDSSNNVIVTGFRRISGNDNYYTIKYDSNGNVLWEREYDSTGTDEAYGVAVDSNNNVIVTGRANNNYFTRKYDSSGNVLWDKEYDGGWTDYAGDVVVDSSNNVIITGRSLFNNNRYDYYTIKYDSNGNVIWERRYSGGSINRAYGVAVDSNNNVIVTGFRRFGTDSIYTIKYDSSGTIIWDRSYSRALAENDVGLERNGVVVDSYNNIIVAGSVNNGTNWDYYTLKYEGFSPAALTSSISATPTTVTPGQTITVVMTVNNTGGEQVNGVSPSSLTLGGTSTATGPVTGPLPAPPISIAAGGSATFTWTYTAGSAGTVNFTGNASGTGAVSGSSVSSTANTSNDVTIIASGVLTSSISATPTTVTPGQTITVVMTVNNTGGEQVNGVSPSSLTLGGTSTATGPVTGPLPAPPISIAAGGSATFTWTYTAGSAGTVNFTGNASGTGAVSGSSVSSTANTSNDVTIIASGVLTSSISATPTTVTPGQTITVVMTVNNTGGEQVNGVSPSSLTLGGTSTATGPVTGPLPAPPISIAAGGSATFTWTYTAGSAGTVNFTGNASGTGAVSGSSVSSTANTSNDVTIIASGVLTSSISATPTTVTPGQTITVVMTVNNTGGEQVNGVSPSSLTLGGTSTATGPVTGPLPAPPISIAAGGSATFTWTYTAGSAGTVNFTGNASGTGAVSGSSVSSTANTSNDVTILRNTPLPETILYPGVTLQRLIVPTSPILIDGSIDSIIRAGIIIIIDGKEVPVLELSEGTRIILAQVENPGFLTQTDATIKFEKLPQGITIKIDPQFQKIKAHSTGSYILTINVSPEVPKGEYLITVTAYTRRGVLDTETIKLVIN